MVPALLLLLCSLSPLRPEPTDAWTARRAALDRVYAVEEFRIFYTLRGPDALPAKLRSDMDRDGHPDLVQLVVQQLLGARGVLIGEMDLMHPLRSPRYGGRARFIDVHLLKLPLESGGPRGGIAYDGLVHFARPVDRGRTVRVLAIDLNYALPQYNATPAHELFHLIQYGYTAFKNRWYLEGTARWAEAVVRSRQGRTGPLPRTMADVQTLFGQTYAAHVFWHTVGNRVDAAYRGRRFMKAFLEALGRAEVEAGRRWGRHPNRWAEGEQRDGRNNGYIWNALVETLDQEPFRRGLDDELRAMSRIRF